MVVLLLSFDGSQIYPGDWRTLLRRSIYAKEWKGPVPHTGVTLLLGAPWTGRVDYPTDATVEAVAIHPGSGITQVTCTMTGTLDELTECNAEALIKQLTADGWQGFADDDTLDMSKVQWH